MILNTPTLLTITRILLLPVILVVFYIKAPWARPLCCAIFLLAAITDWLDGYLARKWNIESEFGAFLDPVADKLMVATVLILIVEDASTRAKVAVSYLGKLKTTAQITALAMLLHKVDLFGLPIYAMGVVSLYIAAALTIWSMADYLMAAFKSEPS